MEKYLWIHCQWNRVSSSIGRFSCQSQSHQSFHWKCSRKYKCMLMLEEQVVVLHMGNYYTSTVIYFGNRALWGLSWFSNIRCICCQTKDPGRPHSLWLSSEFHCFLTHVIDWWDRVQWFLSDFYTLWFVSYAAVCLSFCHLFSLQVEVYILSVYIYVWDPFHVAGELQLKDVELKTDITVWAIYSMYLFFIRVCLCVCSSLPGCGIRDTAGTITLIR